MMGFSDGFCEKWRTKTLTCLTITEPFKIGKHLNMTSHYSEKPFCLELLVSVWCLSRSDAPYHKCWASLKGWSEALSIVTGSSHGEGNVKEWLYSKKLSQLTACEFSSDTGFLSSLTDRSVSPPAEHHICRRCQGAGSWKLPACLEFLMCFAEANYLHPQWIPLCTVRSSDTKPNGLRVTVGLSNI